MKKEAIRKVVVIEDDKVCGEIVKQELNRLAKVEVVLFSSAEECFSKMKQQPELIILDFFLGTNGSQNMNGHEALNQIRTNNSDQKVLFISTVSEIDLLEQYKVYRSVDYIEKSCLGTGRMIEKVKCQLSAA